MASRSALWALVLTAALTALWGQAPTVDRSTPGAVAKAYLEALARSDVEAALMCLDPATEARGARTLLNRLAGKGAPLDQTVTEMLLLPVAKQVQYEAGELQQEGDTARLAVMATVALPQTLVLRQAADGTWFVDLTQSAKASTGLDRTLVLRDLGAPPPVECISNLKMLALAVLMWAQDHDGALPSASGWSRELKPYIEKPEVFRCPDAPDLQCGYAYNLEVAGRKLAAIARPAETVLFYESTLGTFDAADRGESQPQPGRHKGGCNRAFVDGHVQYVKPGAP